MHKKNEILLIRNRVEKILNENAVNIPNQIPKDPVIGGSVWPKTLVGLSLIYLGFIFTGGVSIIISSIAGAFAVALLGLLLIRDYLDKKALEKQFKNALRQFMQGFNNLLTKHHISTKKVKIECWITNFDLINKRKKNGTRETETGINNPPKEPRPTATAADGKISQLTEAQPLCKIRIKFESIKKVFPSIDINISYDTNVFETKPRSRQGKIRSIVYCISDKNGSIIELTGDVQTAINVLDELLLNVPEQERENSIHDIELTEDKSKISLLNESSINSSAMVKFIRNYRWSPYAIEEYGGHRINSYFVKDELKHLGIYEGRVRFTKEKQEKYDERTNIIADVVINPENQRFYIKAFTHAKKRGYFGFDTIIKDTGLYKLKEVIAKLHRENQDVGLINEEKYRYKNMIKEDKYHPTGVGNIMMQELYNRCNNVWMSQHEYMFEYLQVYDIRATLSKNKKNIIIRINPFNDKFTIHVFKSQSSDSELKRGIGPSKLKTILTEIESR